MIKIRQIAIISLTSLAAFTSSADPNGGNGLLSVVNAPALSAGMGPSAVNTVNTHRNWFDQTSTVKASDSGGLAGVLVAKAGQKALVITDFVMTHNVSSTDGTFRVNFRRGPASNANDCDTAGLILGPYVSSGETVSINMSTGLRLEPGEQLCVVVGGASGNEGVTFTLSGYDVFPNAGP